MGASGLWSKQTNLVFVHQIAFQILPASQVLLENFQQRVRDRHARNYRSNANWESFFPVLLLVGLKPNFRLVDESGKIHGRWQLNMARILASADDCRNAFPLFESTRR